VLVRPLRVGHLDPDDRPLERRGRPRLCAPHDPQAAVLRPSRPTPRRPMASPPARPASRRMGSREPSRPQPERQSSPAR
jgi:hypothetical protein